MVFADELAGDDGPEDVVGALPDRHQGRIPIETFDLILRRIAVTAVDPHRLERRSDADLVGVELCHTRLEVGPPAGVERGGGPPGEQARRLDFGRHVRELQLDRLELRDGPAERVAVARIRERTVEARLRHAHRAAGYVDAPELEG